jgi:hypothetical protein
VHGASTFHRVRVNCFMMMARLAQYWLMNFYSRLLDQRMSIIGKIRNRILMGQMRQTSDDLTEHEEQDRRAAGYIDEPKNESYLPSSVHGSPRHMATAWDWQRGDNNPLISKPSSNANTAIVRRPGTNQIRLISGRVASVGGVPDGG